MDEEGEEEVGQKEEFGGARLEGSTEEVRDERRQNQAVTLMQNDLIDAVSQSCSAS